jgi:hypothetical protein
MVYFRDMPLNKETVKKFCYKLGHEMAKEKHKSKSSTLKENDKECQECRHTIKKLFRETKPGNSGTVLYFIKIKIFKGLTVLFEEILKYSSSHRYHH